jgi:PAS domain-containing serine/threonine kinase
MNNFFLQAIRSCAQSNVIPQQPSTRPGSVSVLSQCDDDQTSGDYGEHYTTLQQIGKGAYGYVKMAFRNEDGLLVCIFSVLKYLLGLS